MVGALLGALVVVGLEVLLRLHRLHRLALGLDHRRDVDERGRHEVAQLGLVGLEQEERGRRDRVEGAGHAGARGGRAGARDDLIGDWVVGVEGVGVGVGDQHVGSELADRVHDLREPLRADLERVVAEVERLELGAERGGGLLGLGMADLLDVLDRLVGLLPQLARLAALAVGERDHLGGPAVAGGDRDRAAGAPHEVGGVRTDHQHAPRHRPASACCQRPWCGPPRR